VELKIPIGYQSVSDTWSLAKAIRKVEWAPVITFLEDDGIARLIAFSCAVSLSELAV